MVLVFQLPTSTLSSSMHCLLTSFQSLSLTDFPVLPPSHEPNQAPLTTSPSLITLLFHLHGLLYNSFINLFSFILNERSYPELNIFFLLPSLMASFSFHIQLHFLDAVYLPPKDSGSCTWNKWFSLSTTSPHLCSVH